MAYHLPPFHNSYIRIVKFRYRFSIDQNLIIFHLYSYPGILITVFANNDLFFFCVLQFILRALAVYVVIENVPALSINKNILFI